MASKEGERESVTEAEPPRSSPAKSRSDVSRRSSKSSKQSTSSAQLRAAKARLEIARKEAELIKRQAKAKEELALSRIEEELSAELKIIEEERKVVEAEESLNDNASAIDDDPVDPVDTYERTKNYVESIDNEVVINPGNQHAAPPPGLSQYFLKRELLSSCLTKFSDNPLDYVNWMTTFKRVIVDLNVSNQEELDLLIKWLGPESVHQATRIRAANSQAPDLAVLKIWQRLEERYGAPELILAALQRKLDGFERITNNFKKLYELCDLIQEILCVKENSRYGHVLAHFDSPVGVNPILHKIPIYMQRKWPEKARTFKLKNGVAYPPFSFFSSFLEHETALVNDPSFTHSASVPDREVKKKVFVSTRKTDADIEVEKCPLHPNGKGHCLRECKAFIKLTANEKRDCLKEHRMCFRCCNSNSHRAKDCKAEISCALCKSTRHLTELHLEKSPKTRQEKTQREATENGSDASSNEVSCKCLHLCGTTASKSCAKIVKVNVFIKGNPNNKVHTYAIIDDQSNKSLAHPNLFDALKPNGKFDEINYKLTSCNGSQTTSGRICHDFIVEGMNSVQHEIREVIECDELPQNRDEIPTPTIVANFEHLRKIQNDIPPLDDTPVLLLLGRDTPIVHHVHEQIIGPVGPFAQRLSLGWVVIGEICLGGRHTPNVINSKKTSVIDGRTSILPVCDGKFSVKNNPQIGMPSTNIFATTCEDNKIGISIDDRTFVGIMERKCHRNSDGYWVAPLPFKEENVMLPNNREIALKRTKYLDASLKRNPQKQGHFVDFMKKVIDSGAAEVAPNKKQGLWYLPIFGVYHPKKPEKIRGVFDSSATHEGVSLNQMLLTGPNITNNLLEILLRFRQDQVAITADVEQMFYSFLVSEEDRDYLRFFWYKDNNPSQSLVEYRMRAHAFGNSPSPAIATYCLRKSVESSDEKIKLFVNKNFYVDDALLSCPTQEEAVKVLKETQLILHKSRLRLHKIASNSKSLMEKFLEEDLQSELKLMDIEEGNEYVSHTLGLAWNLKTDCFKFQIDLKTNPPTRRGMLSTVNSVFDPIGFVAPVILQGKQLFRQATEEGSWDDPLSPEVDEKWQAWVENLKILEDVSIPRMYTTTSLTKANDLELLIFSDASEIAISAVAYIQKANGKLGFALGKCKLAPSKGQTIPRLELCAALLAAEIGDFVKGALDVEFKAVKFYCDSRIVLGYIHNKSRRFQNYVSNRVEKILTLSTCEQWAYVHTKVNPADIGSRGCSTVDQLMRWIDGPKVMPNEQGEIYNLVSPDEDKDIRKKLTNISNVNTASMSARFSRFSGWKRLVTAIATLKRAIRNFKNKESTETGQPITLNDLRRETENYVISRDQQETFSEEINSLKNDKPLPKNSPLTTLNPWIDEKGLLRIGGRISGSLFHTQLVQPTILSSKTHLAKLIVKHHHEKCEHQGRLFTESSIRSGGYWIIGAKRLISRLIYDCVTCRKLRRKPESQQMSNLPPERLTPSPPFTFVGVDVFGPWTVVSRKTRGGMAESKRWAVLFTCLGSRAVHIEVIESMTSSSFINALRRFITIRGPVKVFWSDRGTNFVGAVGELKVNVVNVEDKQFKSYLDGVETTWKFNAPHSSHMGGVWERMIGVARQILDKMLSDPKYKPLTHEVLVTLMAEVAAIINSRPITPVTSDPDCALISPATLLNQKLLSCDSEIQACIRINPKELYVSQWKAVQVMSDEFWRQWKNGYLQTLQSRRKWDERRPCIKTGDVVLLKDKLTPRNQWHAGIIEKVFPSETDNLVRKAEVRIVKDGKSNTYTRPINEMVLLLD